MASKRKQRRDEMREREKLRAKKCGSDGHFKVKYENEQRARSAALSLGFRQHETISHYRCTFCGSWHIGHTPKEKR